jgi:hypothetical protein
VQHFIPWRCLNKVLVLTANWGHLREWNATTQVQNPSTIIWEKSDQFGYYRIRSLCNIAFPRSAPTRCRRRRLVEVTLRNGMQQYQSKIHWRLYEEKCPIRLLQNRVLVQHFIPWKCLNKVSILTASCGHLREWNATTQVQHPLTIIWEKVPSLAMAEFGRGATFHSLEVPQQGVGPDG